jgi:fructose transport system ATP-binding protein
VTASDLPLLPILECEGLTKTYGSVVALDHVDFAVYPGEVLAVVGDNGAGKSTLVRCLAAAEIPDSGTVRLDGAVVRFRTAREARTAGINAIFQSVDADDAIDIATNLYRDREQADPGPLGKARARTLLWMESNGMRRSAAASPSKVVLLDEPTAVLGRKESAKVHHFIEHLRGRGLPIVVVSHSLPQVLELADRIHVQRLGARVAVVIPDSVDASDLVAIMSGALHVDPKDQALGPVR